MKKFFNKVQNKANELAIRSEERRVGEEGHISSGTRGSPNH